MKSHQKEHQSTIRLACSEQSEQLLSTPAECRDVKSERAAKSFHHSFTRYDIAFASTSCLIPACLFGTIHAVWALHVPSISHVLNCFFAAFLEYGSAGLIGFVGFATMFLTFSTKLSFRHLCLLSLVGALLAPTIFFPLRDHIFDLLLRGRTGLSLIDIAVQYLPPYLTAGLLSGSTSMALLAWKTAVSPGRDNLMVADQLSE